MDSMWGVVHNELLDYVGGEKWKIGFSSVQ